jgi:hypothetical protein
MPEAHRYRTAPVGFRHGRVVTAHTYNALAALSKHTFRARAQSVADATRTGSSARAHRRAHRGAAGRASSASLGRCGVRTATVKGQTPTISGLEAPGALRRTLHAAYAGKTFHIALYRPGAHVPAERFWCNRRSYAADAGALRMRQYRAHPDDLEQLSCI